MLAAILAAWSHDSPVNRDVNSFSLRSRRSLRDCRDSGWSADSGCLVGDLEITSTRGTDWKKTPHTDLSSGFVFVNEILSLTTRCETVEVDWTVFGFYCIQSVSTCRGANASQQLSAGITLMSVNTNTNSADSLMSRLSLSAVCAQWYSGNSSYWQSMCCFMG